jgi:hypothetical protein
MPAAPEVPPNPNFMEATTRFLMMMPFGESHRGWAVSGLFTALVSAIRLTYWPKRDQVAVLRS